MKKIFALLRNSTLWIQKNWIWIKWVLLGFVGVAAVGIVKKRILRKDDKKEQKERAAYKDALSKSNNEIAIQTKKVKKDIEKVNSLKKQMKTNTLRAKGLSGTAINKELSKLGL